MASFRRNAGAVIFNRFGQALCGKRLKFGTWQLPQGGIEAGETPQQAAVRELQEEIGLDAKQLRFVAEVPNGDEWLAYEWPADVQVDAEKKPFAGQQQKFSLFYWDGPPSACRLDAFQEPEFSEVQWKNLDTVVEQIADFKRPVYQRLHELSSPIIANYSKQLQTETSGVL